MKKILFYILIPLSILPLVYLLGPVVEYNSPDPQIKLSAIHLDTLNNYIEDRELKVAGLRPNNQSRVVWADSLRKTEYSLVYIHGFSASQMEGDPVHREIAKRYGMNLYLARLDGHGIDSQDALRYVTPYSMVESAKEAIVIGKAIGEKVIVMSCSTGGTLAIYLAAHNAELIEALIFYSPNIELFDPAAKLLTRPWGLQIAKQIVGEVREIPEYFGTVFEQYTTSRYRVEGIIALQALLDQTMKPAVFAKINQPYFLGYYFKNETLQDKVVSVEAMLNFDSFTSASEETKRVIAFENVGNHVIPSGLHSKDIEGVISETAAFLEEVIGIKPVSQ